MNYRRRIPIMLSLVIVTLVSCSTLGQKPAGITKPEGFPITIKGKIEFMKNLGGYFVLGEEPTREYFIMNQDIKLLEALFKSGKIVTIEGRIVRGAEYLFIEKIDGQPYTGKE